MIEFNDPTNWLTTRINGVKKAYYVPDEFNGFGVAVDVGANVGGFPIVNHNKFEKIYCFEPAEYTYNECLKNIEMFDNVKLYKYAVSNKSGDKIKLKAYKASNYSGNASTYDDDRWDDNNYEMVETITIEDIYEIIGTKEIDYLKVDCEGSEYNLLMNKDLSKIKYISVEIHIQLKEKLSKLIDYLKKYFDVLIDLNDGITMHKEMTFKNKKI